MTKRVSLGKNLSALLGGDLVHTEIHPGASELRHLPVTYLTPSPYQPRLWMDDVALQELADSIQKQGLLQPIVVRLLKENQYEIIAGERRYRAAILADLQIVPVIIKSVDNETAMALALVENLQREDLNPVEQARAMARLIEECGLTHQQVADLLSKSRASVSNFLRLLSLEPSVMRLLEHGDIDMGHARTLLVFSHEEQVVLAEEIISHHLSVRDTEKLANRLKQKNSQIPLDPLPTAFEWDKTIQSLQQYFKTNIAIKPNKKGGGTLMIQFDSKGSLSAIFSKMMAVHSETEITESD